MCNRCDWATSSELEKIYHDTEWGKINKDEHYLFEMLCLEGMQAGLSWNLILQKRTAYQDAFHNFDIQKVIEMTDSELEIRLDGSYNIIKNRNKVFSIRNNAQRFLEIQEEFDSFAAYIWHFSEGKQIVNNWQEIQELPAESPLSQEVSKDLKKRGFKFVGPVIIYSYLQAIGMINDHLIDCDFR